MMAAHLCLTIQFLQPAYHGRCDGGQPEWPPSPLRVFQSLVAAGCRRWQDDLFRADVVPALRWLEQQPPPCIAAPEGWLAESPYRLYVPDNTSDLAAGAWCRGDTARIVRRTEKDVRPRHLPDFAEVHYLYPLGEEGRPYGQLLCETARSVTHLGWGVDVVVGNACLKTERELTQMPGEMWRPTPDAGLTALRTPVEGTLDAILAKHMDFLSRIGRDAKASDSFNPVPPLTAFRVAGYRRTTDPIARPHAIFELRTEDGSFLSYPQRQLIHIAGMVRHLAIEATTKSPPAGVPDDWVDTYVAGHDRRNDPEHRQFSFLPLPSIGHPHVDPSVRRVMVTAPVGDDRLLDHLAMLLTGQQLKPTDQTRLNSSITLVRTRRDKMAHAYLRESNTWASVTPVILPGHDDRKPTKTRKLIEKALGQSGIELPCEFEWSPFSHFPKSLSAHKYDKEKRPTGYIRPDHLLSQTAVHLTLRFKDGVKMPGPLCIGAGRHCGLGLFAALDE
ncbi:MAG: type I-U CRISPR-associated protein Csb2 [Patescibacteria group bacterium]|nr:type I-U CRISPR-associated protein Csb2 [Patescibacteria group bacterium]